MPTLYLIPVPIADEALHTLPAHTVGIAQALDTFIVERAKTARHFLKAAGIKKPLPEVTVVEIDDKDPKVANTALEAAHKAGKDVGLLSEAGCPGVADPGARVVERAHAMGMTVRPLTGPSSLLLALMASGMNGQQFVFHGYLSPKRPELLRDLRRLEQASERLDQTQIFIETPYRSQMVLEVALESLQPQTQFCVAQDITGANEWVRSLPIGQWKKQPAKTLDKAPAVFLVYKKPTR
jgi:16S rRNA (cytidine1402-2'-O)-methyltransferase